MTLYNLFGPLDALLAGPIEYVLLVLVVINMATRAIEHRTQVEQYESDGADAIERHPARVATNVLLVLGAFYFLTLNHHPGMVTSVLVLGLVITDFFEFESRKVEARREIDLDRPKAALGASVLVLAYVSYISLFFLVKGIWNMVI
ncbi:MAG: hypothetical protein ABEI96_01705 [Haloarculaceae archaeon]